MFYLLAFAVALTTIFGLAHSQSARETLRLQSFYVWSVRAIQQQLQYELLDVPEQYENNNDTDEFVEITIEQTEPQKLEKTESLESFEEINADEQSGFIVEEIQQDINVPPYQRIKEEHDSVLTAINASLQKLSVAVNSGKVTGAQLFEILVKETQLYDKTLHKQSKNDSENNQNTNTTVIEEITNEESGTNSTNETQKSTMYFGESPRDYVPHQE